MSDLEQVLADAVKEAVNDAQVWESERLKNPGDFGAVFKSMETKNRLLSMVWLIERMVKAGVLKKAVGEVLIWNLQPHDQVAASEQD